MLKRLFNRLMPDLYLDEAPYMGLKDIQEPSLFRVILAENFPRLFPLDKKFVRAFDDAATLEALSRAHKRDLREKENRERHIAVIRDQREYIAKIAENFPDPINHKINEGGTIAFCFECPFTEIDGRHNWVFQPYNLTTGLSPEENWEHIVNLAKITNMRLLQSIDKDIELNSAAFHPQKPPPPPQLLN